MLTNLWVRDFLESTRGQLVALLRRGPATVEEVAGPLGLTANAVRAHLQVLMRDGLVRPAGVRRTDGAGKPATLYELTPSAEPVFSKAYLPVLEALLVAVAEEPGPATRERILTAAAHELAAQAGASLEEPNQRPVDRAVGIMTALGGMVDVVPSDEGVILQGHGCPLSLLTGPHPEACRLVQLILMNVTGRRIAEACDRGERCRCRFILPDAPANVKDGAGNAT